ncbi:hypothetical protein V9T40_003472 [Parthenolecanium corni]|uniref:Uncharacterized protein n=1 Tax=Parthenolecanium corni TaxID=536013 RepID=A0AAN9U2N8_9HEMI
MKQRYKTTRSISTERYQSAISNALFGNTKTHAQPEPLISIYHTFCSFARWLVFICQLKNVSMSKSDVIKTLRDNANATMRTDANSGMLEREVVEVEPITARRERSAANKQRGAYQLPLLL